MKAFRSFFILVTIVVSSQALFGQTKHFTGEWTKIGTKYIFEFNLHLIHKKNQVEGYFDWKIVQLDKGSQQSETYYKNRIGLTAREYVKGNYLKNQKEYFLKGYKKDDPNKIISTDVYRLKIDNEGNIGGDTRANGTWQGRINGSSVSVGPV